MPVRLPEVGVVLAVVTLLIAARRVPLLAILPLTQITGVLCFSFAIYLALRLFNFELARIRAEE